MPDDPSAYGSYMNFFLPRSARVGNPNLPVPGLFDLLSGGKPGTPEEEQRKKEQEQQKQGMALGQQGMKLMQPQQPQFMPLPQVQTAAPPPPQMPAAQPGPEPAPAQPSYDPRDPRFRNPIAGMPTPFGGFYR